MLKKLLDYDFPDDLKSMSIDEMEWLAGEIRRFLIDKVSKTGGHLASNLGVVEIAIALHREFDSPEDKFIWDVGHQSYVHKILTGRADRFDDLRHLGGISGFPKRSESPHDKFDTGHSSTSLSVATGMAVARDLRGEDYNVVAIIGDGALTGGIAYEALNNLGALKTKVITVINDNGMSISENVGGLSTYLKKLRNPKKYESVVEGILFDGIGVKYIGPIDGHNIKTVINAINLAKKIDGPVVIHAKTIKGKGYGFAEQTPDKFHGVGPFNPNSGELVKNNTYPSYSAIFGEKLTDMALKDDRIAVVCAAMIDGTGLNVFDEVIPERTFDVGIAEEHAVTFAAGLANNGMRPVVAIYSTFLQRAYDQIVEDVCLQKLPVVFAIDRAGIVGPDGETHHGIFDISYLMHMPGMTVLAPRDGKELSDMLQYAVTLDGPCAIRYPRGANTVIEGLPEGEFGEGSEVISEGTDVVIWAVGSMVRTALDVRLLLEQRGVNAGVVNVRWIKPFDRDLLHSMSGSGRLLVTMEDNVFEGGFGQTVSAACINDALDIKVHNFAWPDVFVQHGRTNELMKQYGLDSETVTERIIQILEDR